MKTTQADNPTDRPFTNRVVVITGASSGIGLATALAFARRGAAVVLAARRTEALQQAVEDCEREGGRALAVTADVTDEVALRNVAQQAIATYGGLDVWINNAGVGIFGPFAGADLRAQRRVVETNLFGAMNGAAAALPTFIRQERGVLITNISIGGFVPVPFAAAYTASKFALRGFTASLRQELRHLPDVRVCSVFPSTVDTPGFAHGANVSGRKLGASGPVLSPQTVAEAMVSLVERPRDEVSVGWTTSLGKTAYALAPRTTESVVGAAFRFFLGRGEPESPTMGNLFEPVKEGTGMTGGWRKPHRPPARGRTRLMIGGGLLIAGAAVLASAAYGGRERRRRRPTGNAGGRMATRPAPETAAAPISQGALQA